MGWWEEKKKKTLDWAAKKQAKGLQEAKAQKTDEIIENDYATARRSMLGELASEPETQCQPCLVASKAARRKERLDLICRALLACPEQFSAAENLRRDMDEVENMRCAKHVYLANAPDVPADLHDNPPPGFKTATAKDLAKMGLTQKMLSPEDSNFRAAVYMKDPAVWGENPSPAAVLAFRGSTPAQEDWENNFHQNSNMEAPYYRNAVKIGNALAASQADVYLVGHSLGGGLASAAQGGSGLEASTYNAAGLHPKTVARYSNDANHVAAEDDKITAYRLDGEVLTTTQEKSWKSPMSEVAVGRKVNMTPSHDEAYFNALKKAGKVSEDDNYASYLHGMDEVIDTMEAHKMKNETAIKACLSKKKLT